MSDDAESLGDGRVLRETDAALLVELESGETVWIPKSCVHEDSEVWKDGQVGDVVVKRWFAEKNGLA